MCGLLEKFRPKKILEVGVASGGTTGIMLNCSEKIGQEYSMYSVDVSERYYRNDKLQSGFIAQDIRKNLSVETHKFYLGTTLPYVLDEIGDEIDFLILDTTHMMPGENLDFLVTLPFLTPDATVCLHDVMMSQHSKKNSLHTATTSLFSAVVADKLLNLEISKNLSFQYPNIAAFKISPDTMKYIENVFLTLILPWYWFPDAKAIRGYGNMLARLYPKELFTIFMEALRLNLKRANS